MNENLFATKVYENITTSGSNKTNPIKPNTNPTCRGVASGEAGSNPISKGAPMPKVSSCVFKAEFSRKPFAVRAQAGRLQYVALAALGLEIQTELVSPKKIPPVLVVFNRINQIDIRPDNNSPALWLSRAPNSFIQLKTKYSRRFYLTIKCIQQAYIDPYLR